MTQRTNHRQIESAEPSLAVVGLRVIAARISLVLVLLITTGGAG